MQVSARNVIKGKVKHIHAGPINAEVVVEISPGIEITSTLTNKSCESLKLVEGKEAYVIIKASNVMLGVD